MNRLTNILLIPILALLPLFAGGCEAFRGGVRDFNAGLLELEQSFDALRGLANRLKSGAVSLAELQKELLELFKHIESLTPEDEARIKNELNKILEEVPIEQEEEVRNLFGQVEVMLQEPIPAPVEPHQQPDADDQENIPTDPDLNGDGKLEAIELIGFVAMGIMGLLAAVVAFYLHRLVKAQEPAGSQGPGPGDDLAARIEAAVERRGHAEFLRKIERLYEQEEMRKAAEKRPTVAPDMSGWSVEKERAAQEKATE